MNVSLKEQARRLPVPSASLVPLMRVLASDEPKFSDIANVVRQDPALALQVLRAANSAAFEGSAPIETLDRALIRMGQERVVRWALALATRSMDAPLSGYQAPQGIRQVSLLRALIAEMLADETRLVEAGVAYSAALLADIGKLVMDGELACQPLKEGDRFVDRERKTFGVDHAQLSARVARQWGLPETLIRLIRYHHTPDAPGAPAAAKLVCAADALADAVAPTGIDGLANPAPQVVDDLGLEEDTLDMILMRATLVHQEMMESLS